MPDRGERLRHRVTCLAMHRASAPLAFDSLVQNPLALAPVARCSRSRRRDGAQQRRRHSSPQNQHTVAWVTATWLRGPNRSGEDTMRTFFTAAGMAVGLLAVWAALVPFVS
jgi:hypothetical protein